MLTVIQPKRILVIPPRFIGDCVLAQSLISSIKAAHPLCPIHLLIPEHIQNWFEHCPDITEIHTMTPHFGKQFALFRRIKPDTLLLLRRSLSDAFCGFLAGTPNRVGFSSLRLFGTYKPLKLFLTHTTLYPSCQSTTPHLQSLQNILHDWDVQTFLNPTCYTTREDEHLASFICEKFNITPQKTVIIHLASASKEKIMTIEQFIPTLRYLNDRGFKILAIGSQNESHFYTELEKLSTVSIINLCGETSLRVSALLLGKVALLLSLDSGPVHMAATTNCPNIIAIYGPTSHQQWGPWPYTGNFTPIFNPELMCRPCIPKVCEHNQCRVGLTPDMIYYQVKKHVERFVMF